MAAVDGFCKLANELKTDYTLLRDPIKIILHWEGKIKMMKMYDTPLQGTKHVSKNKKLHHIHRRLVALVCKKYLIINGQDCLITLPK